MTIGLLPMNDDLLRLIGLVTVYWGHFEFRFGRVLEGLLAHTRIEEHG